MNKIPLVTVLMPAYNAGEYVRQAVDSVLAQTFTDFELLVINDGSTDDTKDILSSYHDKRLTIVNQLNAGLVETLNRGLRLAKGKWIARFDADDICFPDRLEIQMSFLNENRDFILVGSDAEYLDKDSNYLFTFKNRWYSDEDIKASGFRECPFIHSSVMFLKEAVMQAGGYNKYALTFEDHLLWRDLAKYGKMANLPVPLIKVHFNPGSATIDEKWRGKEFNEIKAHSVQSGIVSASDAEKLQKIVRSQDFKKYKEAAYYSMVAKKYLWDNYAPAKARAHLRKAIAIMPAKSEPYLLYLLSFLPQNTIKGIYKKIKNKQD